MVRFLTLLTLLALAAPAGAARYPTVHCDAVKGKVVRRNAAVKIVRQPRHSISQRDHDEFVGYRYVGCALPNGKAHVLAEGGTNYLYSDGKRGDLFSEETITVARLVGRFAYLEDSYSSNDALGQSGLVAEVDGGKVHSAWATGDLGGDEDVPAAWRLGANGIFAAILPKAGQSTVVAQLFGAKRQTLDTAPPDAIPAASLRLRATTVSWTNAGAPKTATVS